jgi:hypothetical protein
MRFKEVAFKVVANAKLLPLYDVFGGLSEFYAFIFMTAGITLAFLGKLTADFAAMITAVQGLLIAHDALDDFHSRKMREGNGERILKDAVQPSDPTQK